MRLRKKTRAEIFFILAIALHVALDNLSKSQEIIDNLLNPQQPPEASYLHLFDQQRDEKSQLLAVDFRALFVY
jgi:hypothetical protein